MTDDKDTQIRVFLVDDHPVVLEGLRSGLSEYPRLDIVGTALSASDAHPAIANGDFDLLLMDLNLPDVADGLELLNFTTSKCPECKIVVLTYSDRPEDIFDTNQAGAHAYLIKDLDLDELAEALQVVMSGGRPPLRSDLEAALWSRLREVPPAKIPYGLSQREWHILRLMAAGKTNEDIAQELFLSSRVVRRCNTEIFQKLDVHNRGEALALAMHKNLFS